MTLFIENVSNFNLYLSVFEKWVGDFHFSGLLKMILWKLERSNLRGSLNMNPFVSKKMFINFLLTPLLNKSNGA